MQLLPGVTAHDITTERLAMHWIEYGPTDGVPVVLIQGNLSTGRFYEHVLAGLARRAEAGGITLRLIAPDMRGFGRTEARVIDATRGLRDWSDDIASLMAALGIDRPIHLAGWSSAGQAIAHYAIEHGRSGDGSTGGGTGVASLIFIDPVSPYGYGGCHRDGTPCAPDWAGAGGGGVNPELVKLLADGDRSSDSPFSIRNVMNALYWNPSFRLSPEREDVLVDEVLLTTIGDGVYPGDAAGSEHWPGFAPGVGGILNALAGAYGRWDHLVDLADKPPVLWTHGADDLVVADGAALEMGALGASGAIPGWPGADDYPPQPMVTQIRDVLDAYAAGGGTVRIEMFDGSGHGPLFDAEEQWCDVVAEFVVAAETEGRADPVS